MKTLVLNLTLIVCLRGADQDWNQLIRRGVRAVIDRRYTEAEKNFNAALTQLGTAPDSDPRVTETLHQLTIAYVSQCRFQEAERLCLRVVRIRQREFGDTLSTALSELILAVVYRSEWRFAESERWTRSALSIFEQYKETAGDEIGAAYHSLARAFIGQGKFKEAEKAANQALSAWPPDADHRIHRAGALSALGSIYARTGALEQSAQYYATALAALEEEFGFDHPRLIPDLTNFGLLELKRNRYAEAEAHARRACKISAATIGDQHVDWANAAMILADSLTAQSRTQEAGQLYERAVPLLGRLLGSENESYGHALRSYAKFLRQTKRPREAKQADARASTILTTRRQTVDVMELQR